VYHWTGLLDGLRPIIIILNGGRADLQGILWLGEVEDDLNLPFNIL